MPFADLAEVRIFYTDDQPSDGTAEGLPLLLVHGWGSDSHDWNWHIPTLAESRRVIAVDLRGHGYSSAPETGYTPQDFAADLVGLLDSLGIAQVIAIGHSMGGQVVTTLAVEHRERVKALVCLDPGYGVAPEIAVFFPESVQALQQAAHPTALVIDEYCYTPASPPLLKTWHTRKTLGAPPHVLAQAFAGMFTVPGQFGSRPASDAYVAQRDCPVLSIWFDPAQAEWERGLFKHPPSNALSWPGSGHRLHEERPAEFLLVLHDWLSTVE